MGNNLPGTHSETGNQAKLLNYISETRPEALAQIQKIDAGSPLNQKLLDALSSDLRLFHDQPIDPNSQAHTPRSSARKKFPNLEELLDSNLKKAIQPQKINPTPTPTEDSSQKFTQNYSQKWNLESQSPLSQFPHPDPYQTPTPSPSQSPWTKFDPSQSSKNITIDTTTNSPAPMNILSKTPHQNGKIFWVK